MAATKSRALLTPVQPRHQIRFAAAQPELPRELAGIAAAPGGIDRLSSPAADRANRGQCRDQREEPERRARDAQKRIEIHDHAMRTRRGETWEDVGMRDRDRLAAWFCPAVAYRPAADPQNRPGMGAYPRLGARDKGRNCSSGQP